MVNPSLEMAVMILLSASRWFHPVEVITISSPTFQSTGYINVIDFAPFSAVTPKSVQVSVLG